MTVVYINAQLLDYHNSRLYGVPDSLTRKMQSRMLSHILPLELGNVNSI